MHGNAAALRHSDPEPDQAECCWQHFQMVGNTWQVHESLRRLRQHGWQVLSAPEPGPFDTWTVRVRRPDRCLHIR